MLTRLLLLFIVVPAVELILLIEIGQWIGTLPTIALIFFTGALGAFLARRQGLQVLARMRSEMQTGQLPAGSIFDGVIILIAGAFLMTPGILTDIAGFLCLVPATRDLIKAVIVKRLAGAVQQGQVSFTTAQYRHPSSPRRQEEPDDVIIIDHDDYA